MAPRRIGARPAVERCGQHGVADGIIAQARSRPKNQTGQRAGEPVVEFNPVEDCASVCLVEAASGLPAGAVCGP
jgi:hypothetical protein